MLIDEDLIDLDLMEIEENFRKEIKTLRTGAPNLSAINDSVFIEYFGAFVPVKQVASTKVDKLTVIISPFDASNAKKIEDAINKASLGGSAKVVEKSVYVTFAPMTGEVRQEQLVKLNKMLEEARVKVRQNVRRKYMEEIDSLDKVSEDDQERSRERVQEIVDKAIENLESIAKQRSVEIETV